MFPECSPIASPWLDDVIDTAVILAAGMATRLDNVLTDRPKGFLELGALPIVEESVLRLRRAGVRTIIIVTGHLNQHYEGLARRYPQTIKTVHNEKFETSGSMYSLYRARDELSGSPFLLLESDLIYEPRALGVLLDGPPDSVLLSGPTSGGDEVFVETRDGRLVTMSKDRAAFRTEPAGELVGISRISPELFDIMLDYSEEAFRSTLMVCYETDCLVAAGQRRPIQCPVVDGLLWAEIDDSSHLSRARIEIYPRLPPV